MLPNQAQAQAEVMAWGNINGIRIDGHLMEFKTSLCRADSNWSSIRHTAKEAQPTNYVRDGERQIISPQLDSLFFSQTVRNIAKGKTKVTIDVTSRADSSAHRAFFCLQLPTEGTIKIGSETPASLDEQQSINARQVMVTLPEMQLSVEANNPTQIHLRKNPAHGPAIIYFTLIDSVRFKGQTATNTFTLSVTGDVDKAPVKLRLDANHPGQQFLGIGGNFRLQNAETDPKVIDYNLNNIRIAYGRVEMPWRLWQPTKNFDPIAAAEADSLHPDVQVAMEMARQLHNLDMPVSLAAWFAPDWAIQGAPYEGRRPDGTYGNLLDQNNIQKIYQSIGDYIWYLKKGYGVEAAAFSFNESDLGIDVRQTPQQHRAFIRGLGEHLASRDLATKLYLGDTADANGYPFTYPAKNDPSVHKYLSAVSFHSWRGWANETLQQWRAISDELNLPVIIGEGSTDAGAWRYSDIFSEPTFAMHEIDLYLRLLSITEAKTILQWQMTADYSLLQGGGVFGNNDEELKPMQRFWNIKQLAATPAKAFHLNIENDSDTITAAAFGDISRQEYAIHLVNNGATREATIHGIPDEVDNFYIFVTNRDRNMEQVQEIPVKNNSATFTAEAWSFISLFSTPLQKD